MSLARGYSRREAIADDVSYRWLLRSDDGAPDNPVAYLSTCFYRHSHDVTATDEHVGG